MRRRADGLGRGLTAVVDGLVDRCQRHGGGEVTGQLGEHRPAIGRMDSLDGLGDGEVGASAGDLAHRRLDRVAHEGVLELEDEAGRSPPT